MWEEVCNQSVHNDLLLRRSSEGAVSRSFYSDRTLSWPGRSDHRWWEVDLVRVNNTVLTVEQAFACLDTIRNEAHLINRLINSCLIRQKLDKDPIDLSDAELQIAMNEFRRARGPHEVEDTCHWLGQQGLTNEQFEQYVAQATISKLCDRVTAGRVEEYFDAPRAAFDSACFADPEFANELSARQICHQNRRSVVDSFQEAQDHFLISAEHVDKPSGDLFGIVKSRKAAPEFGSAVFAAAPGDILGPIRTKAGYSFIRVLSFAPGRLDDSMRDTIKRSCSTSGWRSASHRRRSGGSGAMPVRHRNWSER